MTVGALSGVGISNSVTRWLWADAGLSEPDREQDSRNSGFHSLDFRECIGARPICVRNAGPLCRGSVRFAVWPVSLLEWG